MNRARQAFVRRQQRKRHRLRAVCAEDRFRLSVFRSHRQIYAHIVDDRLHGTLVSATSLEKKIGGMKEEKKTTKGGGCDVARLVGEALAERALKLKIERVAFDCGGYQYHGRVRALAEGARAKGLLF